MKKDKITKKIEESVDIDFSFSDINSSINYPEAKKRNAKRKGLFIALPSCVSILAVICVVVICGPWNKNNSDAGQTSSNNNTDYVPGDNTSIYNGSLIAQIAGAGLEQDNEDGPSYRFHIFDVFKDNNFGIYEVETSHSDSSKLIGAYIKQSTAERIYEEYKDVTDVTCASPLNEIDGTIVSWFYQVPNLSASDIVWYEFHLGWAATVPTNINGYHLSGLYSLESVKLIQEVSTATIINREFSHFWPIAITDEGNNAWFTLSNVRTAFGVNWYFTANRFTSTNEEYFNDFLKNNGTTQLIGQKDENNIMVEYCEDELAASFNAEAENFLIAQQADHVTYDYAHYVSLIQTWKGQNHE